MKKKEPMFEFYTLDHLFKQCPKDKFLYYMIIGERSNGKTFAVQEYALREYLAGHGQLAYIRRYDSDWDGGNTQKVWDGFIDNPYRGNVVEEVSKGRWNSIAFYRGAWYLEKRAKKHEQIGEAEYEPGDLIERDATPFAFRFSLNLDEHYKGTSFPKVTTILFDEFITRGYYLRGGDEFILFQNLISTIVRLETKARVFMLANTISTSCPYFREMGIRKIKEMQNGQIDIYEYGDSGLRVAVELTPNDASRKVKKKSNVYFAFDNPHLAMITQGGWEIDIYPHLPKDYEYTKANIKYVFFIVYEDEIMQGEVIYIKDSLFVFMHRKTTPIKEDNRNLVFTPDYDPRPWYVRRFTKPVYKLHKVIYNLFAQEQVYYQDNELGESVKHYIDWSLNHA